MSPPSRGRGLKLFRYVDNYVDNMVAPFAGAWIETLLQSPKAHAAKVAPFAGAWIETLSRRCMGCKSSVAPFAGAWIETCVMTMLESWSPASPPSRGRGLKQSCAGRQSGIAVVAPFAGAWIETALLSCSI